jgi:glycosyltransferase involved in cell wall biosynthesis
MKVYKNKDSSKEENKIHHLQSYNIKVSIIIPLHNVEKYLRQCLDSVVNQTLKEIEIICVNDGSTDNSLQILEEYAKKDDRVRIINKKNMGVGAARNTGLKYVKGEYIGFVDSDDWVDETMFEKLYRNGRLHNSDIVMCPIIPINENDEEISYQRSGNIPYYNLNYFNDEFNDCSFNYIKTKDFIFKIAVNAYNKIYRSEFINRINAKFPEGLIFEDNPFFYYTFLNAKRSSLVRKLLYFHRVNRAGSLISKGDKRFFDIIKIQNLIINNFLSLPDCDDYEIDLLNHKINVIILRYFQVSEENRQEFYELIKQDFKKMNLNNDVIDHLNLNIKTTFLHVIKSYSHIEFELREEKYNLINRINNLTSQTNQLLKNTNQLTQDNTQLTQDNNQLTQDNNQLTQDNNQLTQDNNQLTADINQLQNQLNVTTNKMMEYLKFSGFLRYKLKNIAYVNILFNKNNNGIKNSLINIRGYRAIKKNHLFDNSYYLKNNPDVMLSGMDPILHYMNYGFKEKRKPNPSFDCDLYLKKYGDVQKSNLNPLVHYSLYGIKEERKIQKKD